MIMMYELNYEESRRSIRRVHVSQALYSQASGEQLVEAALLRPLGNHQGLLAAIGTVMRHAHQPLSALIVKVKLNQTSILRIVSF